MSASVVSVVWQVTAALARLHFGNVVSLCEEAELLLSFIAEAQEAQAKLESAEARQQWRAWLAEAISGGASGAHSFSREKEAWPPRASSPCEGGTSPRAPEAAPASFQNGALMRTCDALAEILSSARTPACGVHGASGTSSILARRAEATEQVRI